MTSTRQMLAEQQEAAAKAEAELAASPPDPASVARPTTLGTRGSDDQTHAERINEFDGPRGPLPEIPAMLSPEQFAELKGLLEPIAEVNILMLPMIRAQVADFEAHIARRADATPPPAPAPKGIYPTLGDAQEACAPRPGLMPVPYDDGSYDLAPIPAEPAPPSE